MALTDAVNQVKKNLEKHGFPQDVVSFPEDQLTNYCQKQGITITNLLDALAEQGIQHHSDEGRIQFRATTKSSGMRNPYEIMQDIAGDLDMEKLREKFGTDPNKKPSFMELLKALGPKKMKDLAKKIAALSPEERQSVMDMAKSMGITNPFGK